MNGIRVDPSNEAAYVDPATLPGLGFDTASMVLLPGILPYLLRCREVGLAIWGVLARESGEPSQYRHYPLDYLEVGNEPDTLSPSSWTMAPEDFYALWYYCKDVLFPHLNLVIGGLASGNTWRGEQYLCVDGAAYAAIHPYSKTPDQIADLLGRYREVTDYPFVLSEWNRPADEIADTLEVIEALTAGGVWFCARNEMVPTFGLLDNPAKLSAWKEGLAHMGELTRRIEQLERQQALQTHALKMLTQGRFSGVLPNAEADVKALNPADTNWTAAEFPEQGRLPYAFELGVT